MAFLLEQPSMPRRLAPLRGATPASAAGRDWPRSNRWQLLGDSLGCALPPATVPAGWGGPAPPRTAS
jgi:hypothetical protein